MPIHATAHTSEQHNQDAVVTSITDEQRVLMDTNRREALKQKYSGIQETDDQT